jgi:uncharacterized protein DUF6950
MNVRKIILDAYRAQRAIPFAWGSADCLCFAARCAEQMIGRDPIAHLRGRYDSETGAKRVMVENGWRDMGDVAASIFPEIPMARAHAGDWALVVTEGWGETIGVVVDDRIAAKTQGGSGQALRSQATRAFRVV